MYLVRLYSTCLPPHAAPPRSQAEVLRAAKAIADSTAALCLACKTAAAAPGISVTAQQQFMRHVKGVATATSSMVANIKALAGSVTEENRARCAEATRPLLAAVASCAEFACSAEFAGTPGTVGEGGRAAQEPLTRAGKALVDASSALIQAAKQLIVEPKDPPVWMQLATQSKVGLRHSVPVAVQPLQCCATAACQPHVRQHSCSIVSRPPCCPSATAATASRHRTLHVGQPTSSTPCLTTGWSVSRV